MAVDQGRLTEHVHVVATSEAFTIIGRSPGSPSGVHDIETFRFIVGSGQVPSAAGEGYCRRPAASG